MYFLKDQLIQLALQLYATLDPTDPAVADRFFETFGPGQRFSHSLSEPVTEYFPDQPFERFSDYETLLTRLQQADAGKYRLIHKGAPYYYMAWLAFDLRNFEKALFYMDAAISEDIRKSPGEWITQPAASFLTLNSTLQVSALTIDSIRRRLNEQLERFNRISGLPTLNLDQFVDRFVRVLVRDTPKRTIISAFYVYLLEHGDRLQELKMSSIAGGSIEPVVMHLFTGGVIFESLLKHCYPTKDNGTPAGTLGDVFATSAFARDFVAGLRTRANSIQDILDAVGDDSLATAFSTTARLRNTTGHNLVWDDVIANAEKYRLLFHQEVNALLYLIATKFR
jgi:hypothetical protein